MYGKPLLLFDDVMSVAGTTRTLNAGSTDPLATYSISHLTDYRPYTFWKGNATTSANGFIVIEDANPAGLTADYVLIMGHDLADQTANVFVRGSNDNFATFTEVLAIAPTDNSPIFVTFPSETNLKWQVTISGIDSPSVLISTLIYGQKLTLPRNLQQGFDPLGSKPRGRLLKSSKGQPLGTAESWREWKQKIRFNNIDASWLRSTWQSAFDSHLKNTPSVFVWDPTDHPTELYLVHPIFNYAAPHVQGQFANLNFILEGLAP